MQASEIRNYLASENPELMALIDFIYYDETTINKLFVAVLDASNESVFSTFLDYVFNNDGVIRVATIDDFIKLPWESAFGEVFTNYCFIYHAKVLKPHKRLFLKLWCKLFLGADPIGLQEAIMYRTLLNRLAEVKG